MWVFHADIVLTYGGFPLAPHLICLAQQTIKRVLFCLHKFEYRDAAFLRDADALWVPSEFARLRPGVEAFLRRIAAR